MREYRRSAYLLAGHDVPHAVARQHEKLVQPRLQRLMQNLRKERLALLTVVTPGEHVRTSGSAVRGSAVKVRPQHSCNTTQSHWAGHQKRYIEIDEMIGWKKHDLPLPTPASSRRLRRPGTRQAHRAGGP